MLVRDPGLPNNLGIIPSVPVIRVTSSRTKLHLAATRALAARTDVRSFGLTLPSPTTDLELMELMTWTSPRLTCLEIQQVSKALYCLPCNLESPQSMQAALGSFAVLLLHSLATDAEVNQLSTCTRPQLF